MYSLEALANRQEQTTSDGTIKYDFFFFIMTSNIVSYMYDMETTTFLKCLHSKDNCKFSKLNHEANNHI